MEPYNTKLVFTADAEIEVGTFDVDAETLVDVRNEIFREDAVIDVEVIGEDEDIYVVLFENGETANLPKEVIGSAPVTLEQPEPEIVENPTPKLSPIVEAALGAEREVILVVNGDVRLPFSVRFPDGFTDEDVIGAAMDKGVIDPDDKVTVEFPQVQQTEQ